MADWPFPCLASGLAAVARALLFPRVNKRLRCHDRGGVRAFVRGEANAGYPPLSFDDFIGNWFSLINTAAARIEPTGAPLGDYI
jgi:hypothetical protein